MNSGELARLAGVSVRALRHYHQVGVLPEPPRASNGYREYRVQDLVTVLRIKRLSGLGMALERIRHLLTGEGEDPLPVLDRLDAELAAEVDRLTAQREVVARLREVGAAPDLPPELAPSLVAFAAVNTSPALARIDREQSILMAHLAGPEGMPYLVELYERLSDPVLLAAAAGLTERFAAVEESSSDSVLRELVDDLVLLLAPVVAAVTADPSAVDLSDAEPLLTEHAVGTLNETQRRVLDEVSARLEAADAAASADHRPATATGQPG